MINKAKELMSQFLVQGNVVDVESYGNGHINTTLHVTVDDNGALREYILQKININKWKQGTKKKTLTKSR